MVLRETAAYCCTMFMPQKLSSERTNYTCNWCDCHFPNKFHLGYSLNFLGFGWLTQCERHAVYFLRLSMKCVFYVLYKQSACVCNKQRKHQNTNTYLRYTFITNHNPAKRTPEPAIKSREKDQQLQTDIKQIHFDMGIGISKTHTKDTQDQRQYLIQINRRKQIGSNTRLREKNNNNNNSNNIHIQPQMKTSYV